MLGVFLSSTNDAACSGWVNYSGGSGPLSLIPLLLLWMSFLKLQG